MHIALAACQGIRWAQGDLGNQQFVISRPCLQGILQLHFQGLPRSDDRHVFESLQGQLVIALASHAPALQGIDLLT